MDKKDFSFDDEPQVVSPKKEEVSRVVASDSYLEIDSLSAHFRTITFSIRESTIGLIDEVKAVLRKNNIKIYKNQIVDIATKYLCEEIINGNTDLLGYAKEEFKQIPNRQKGTPGKRGK
ncbi:MAG TPA: hypothetical protein PLP35_09235 [Caldisericia bacterium]|nr:hypothetical protein [Caldisericia bacterium]HPI84662.1 hypothetical protein [Caldisericia bacterium]HRV75716.1 hypothetical protein [Caldisericia bacterium]